MGRYDGWRDVDPRTIGRNRTASPAKKPSKYHAERTEVDGITFASKREANCYRQLKADPTVQSLELQPRFPLHVVRPDGVKVEVASYVADFRVVRNGMEEILDANGLRTPLYILKRKMTEAEHGVRIVEV